MDLPSAVVLFIKTMLEVVLVSSPTMLRNETDNAEFDFNVVVSIF